MKYLAIAALALSSAFVSPSYAQTKPADTTNMQILRDKIKADKKLVVAANLKLSDADGKTFWPIYDAYQKDLEGINQRIAKLIESYADAYNKNTLNNDTAKKLTDEAIAIEGAEVDLRKNYAGRLGKAGVPATTAARYLQIESKIRAIVRYELAANIPLVP